MLFSIFFMLVKKKWVLLKHFRHLKKDKIQMYASAPSPSTTSFCLITYNSPAILPSKLRDAAQPIPNIQYCMFS